MDDPNKTMPPRRPHDEVIGDDQTMPGKRDRKPDGRFEPGDLIMERYKVLAELGQGGMGVVYKCFDETAGIEIALKALPPELSHNTLEMEDIKENFQLVHNLHHPNIASSNNLEKDNANGNYYLIMECVEGEDLRRWIKSRRRENALNLQAVLPIIRQVADALDYAHEQRIIHRDIKPGNIMIDSAGHVKVLDFGLAAQIHTSMTRVSMAYHGTSGTGPYMAPEQWRGRAQGAPADQYALAVMTYEMLAGHLPFESTDAAVLREAVLNDTPEELSDMPACVRTAITKGMSKDPAERFASCADFVAALEGKKVFGIKRNDKRFRVALAAVIVLIVLGIGYGYYRSAETGRMEKERSSAAVPSRPVSTNQGVPAIGTAATKQDAALAEERRKLEDEKRQLERSRLEVEKAKLEQEKQKLAAGKTAASPQIANSELYKIQSALEKLERQINGLDRGQTFGTYIDVFNEKFDIGKRALMNRDFVTAQENLTAAKKAAEWLWQNAPLRESSQQAMTKVQEQRSLALKVNAPTLAKTIFQSGEMKFAEGNKKFSAVKFQEASSFYHEAESNFRKASEDAKAATTKLCITAAEKARKQKKWDLFWSYIEKLRPLDAKTADSLSSQAEIEIKNQKIASLLSEARNAVKKMKWQQVYDLSNKVLSLSPDNAEAKRLFDKATEILTPRFQIHVFVNGKKTTNVTYYSLGENQKNRLLNEEKWPKKLGRGEHHQYILKHKSKNGDDYIGALLFDVNWTGFKEFRVSLSKIDWKSISDARKRGCRISDDLILTWYEPYDDNLNITHYDIPFGVIGIENKYCVFRNCFSLKTVTIPSSVVWIGHSAFSGLASLVSVTIPSSVTWIGTGAFKECESLSDITIPSSVTCIGNEAFFCCKSLKNVIIPPSVLSVGASAFFLCTSLKSVTIPPSVTSIGRGAFNNCKSLKSVTIPSSVTEIPSETFDGCRSMESVSIPPRVTSIGYNAFYDCKSLKSVTIPPSVTSIGYGTFDGAGCEEQVKRDYPHLFK